MWSVKCGNKCGQFCGQLFNPAKICTAAVDVVTTLVHCLEFQQGKILQEKCGNQCGVWGVVISVANCVDNCSTLPRYVLQP